MLLAIDIGNTNIRLGVFKGGRLLKRYSLATKAKLRLKKYLKKIFSQNKIEDTILCSVVPQVAQGMEKELKRLLGKPPYIIGKNIAVPIKNGYRRPRQAGADRLVNAYAATRLYGAPSVVVDSGTALTFDAVSKKKIYLGGMILPGLEVSLEALGRRAALLPEIKLAKPKEFIGRDTKSSMLSGIVYGFAALTADLAAGIKDKIGRRAKVIGTGGAIGLIGKYCRCFQKIDKNLTLKGLNLVYHQALKNSRGTVREGVQL